MPLFYYNIYVNVSYLHNDQLKEKLWKHACKQTHRVEVILFFLLFFSLQSRFWNTAINERSLLIASFQSKCLRAILRSALTLYNNYHLPQTNERSGTQVDAIICCFYGYTCNFKSIKAVVIQWGCGIQRMSCVITGRMTTVKLNP